MAGVCVNHPLVVRVVAIVTTSAMRARCGVLRVPHTHVVHLHVGASSTRAAHRRVSAAPGNAALPRTAHSGDSLVWTNKSLPCHKSVTDEGIMAVAEQQPLRVGVLALQGSFREHMALLSKIPGVQVVEVRTKEELESVAGLVIPGGESTTMALVVGAQLVAAALAQVPDGVADLGVSRTVHAHTQLPTQRGFPRARRRPSVPPTHGPGDDGAPASPQHRLNDGASYRSCSRFTSRASPYGALAPA